MEEKLFTPKEMSEEILQLVGGRENVESATHCMTRLRLVLKDESIVDEKKLGEYLFVKGINKSSGQFQIILGTGVVNKVYKEFIKHFDNSQELEANARKNQSFIKQALSVLGDVFIPIIPALIAAGMLMGIRSFLVSAGIIATDSTIYTISVILSDTAYTFLPVLVTWSAMKRFGGSQVLGIVIGLMLVHPSLPAQAAIAKGQAEPLLLEIGNRTVEIAGFQGSILPALGVGIFAAYVERFFRKTMPDMLDQILTPLFTTFIALMAGLLILGPAMGLVEDIIVNFYVGLLQLPYGIGGFITGFIQQFLVITGLHHALLIIDVTLLAETGENMFAPIRNAAQMGQMGAALGFALLYRSRKKKATASAAVVSCSCGITEPAIFGVNLVYGLPFVFGAIGGAIGGWFCSITGLTASGMGTSGIPGVFLYMESPEQTALYIISSIISITIPLVLTMIYIKKKELQD